MPPVHAEYLDARLPRSRLAVIDTGHCTWVGAADEYEALETDWWGDPRGRITWRELAPVGRRLG